MSCLSKINLMESAFRFCIKSDNFWKGYFNPIAFDCSITLENRIAKHVWKDETWERSTYYLLDAQGNQVSIYEHNPDAPTVEFNLVENNVYGSSRVGSLHREIDLLTTTYSNNYSTILGNKNYEFTNHPPEDGRSLGNVLTVFTDKKIPKDEDNNGKVDGYEIGIFSTADYSPFGVELDGRSMRPEGYRYGYQGSEKDDEVKGEGNSYTTNYRQLDPRIGRWMTIDPLSAKFPWQSPYISMDNNPISLNDIKGLSTNDWVKKSGSNKIEWDPKVKSPDEAISTYGSGTEYYAPGSYVDNARINKSETVGTVYLGENGKAGYVMDAVNVCAQSVPQPLDDSYSIAQSFSRNVNPSDGYKVADIGALRNSWMNDPDPFIGIINKAAMGAALAPAAIMSLPSIYQYGGGALKYGYEGMKLYHNSIGVNGGYANIGLNWINQSYVQGGNPSDYLSLEGKSITGLILAGTTGYTSMIWKQAAIGAADPWLSINYSNNGFYSDGLHKKGLGKTIGLSTMGIFGPLHQLVPITNSGILNCLIEQGLMAPSQKALTNAE
jgi:RHS repeat-associated protein